MSFQPSAFSLQPETWKVQNFRKLKVWQKAHAATLAVYTATESFPTSERYGLTSQMRRAAASIAANIAEGCGRSSDADSARFLHNAIGSASELEYFLLLSTDLGHLEADVDEDLTGTTEEIKRMTASLIARLKAES